MVCLASGLSLSVAGVFKELLTVLCSSAVLGEPLTFYNVCGLLLCTVGIALYTRFAK